jgi:hypothetical protein
MIDIEILWFQRTGPETRDAIGRTYSATLPAVPRTGEDLSMSTGAGDVLPDGVESIVLRVAEVTWTPGSPVVHLFMEDAPVEIEWTDYDGTEAERERVLGMDPKP